MPKQRNNSMIPKNDVFIDGKAKPSQDLLAGIFSYQIWIKFSLHDIKQRYRRSIIGPMWFVLSNLIFVSVLGVLYAKLLGQDIKGYLPFLAVGFIFWQFIATSLTESTNVLVEASSLIKQVDIPVSTHCLRICARNIIILVHNLPLLIFFPIFMGIELGVELILLPLGMFILFLNAIWLSIVLGLLGARFRDVQPIVQNLVTITFFFTPIMWMPEILADRAMFVQVNPFYHYIEFLRAPLLGYFPSFLTMSIVFIITIIGLFLAWISLLNFRNKLAYWI